MIVRTMSVNDAVRLSRHGAHIADITVTQITHDDYFTPLVHIEPGRDFEPLVIGLWDCDRWDQVRLGIDAHDVLVLPIEEYDR